MATAFHAELVTPERVLFSGDAEEVSLRTDGGEIAFLANHEDFIGAVDITVVRITTASAGGDDATSEVRAAVHGGFVHVATDGVRILASVAELGPEIDTARASRALEEASARGDEIVPTQSGAVHDTDAHDEGDQTALSPTMVALLQPESADAATRRARARLDAAGASPAS